MDELNLLDQLAVRRNFDALAPRYAEVEGLDAEVRERLLSRLDLIKLQPNRVLDLGSGIGDCAKALARRYKAAQIVELDIAPMMLHQSLSRDRRLFSKRVRVAASAEQIPLLPGSFGLVYANLTLAWCSVEKVLRETKLVLQPGGLVAMVTLGPDTLREVASAWSAVDDKPHVHSFMDMHDIGDLLSNLGYQDIVLDSERIQLTYPTTERLLSDLRQLGTGNQHYLRRRTLTGQLRLSAFKKTLLEQANSPQISITCELVYLHAWSPERSGVAVPRVTL